MRYKTLLLLLFLTANTARGENLFSLTDILFWTGNGPHAAALAIDWNGATSTDESLVWGYRWDSTATTEDMLRTVLQADDRLYAKLSESHPWGIALYGLGYDSNADGYFAISDGTTFDDNGIALSGSGSADGAFALASDHYAEGWYEAYWNFSIANENPFHKENSWVAAATGLSDIVLTDGSWNSLAYDADFSLDDYASNPFPAQFPLICDLNFDRVCNTVDIQVLYDQPWDVPPNDPTLDLNRDNVMDHADLDLWLLNAGTSQGFATPYLRGDSNLDRRIDVTDFNTLANHFAPVGSSGIIPQWKFGNFDANEHIDITDFHFLAENFSPDNYATNKTIRSALIQPHHFLSLAVPEPSGWMLWTVLLTTGMTLWRM